MSETQDRLTFETIEVGRSYVSSGRTVTASDHGLFILVSGDWHPIHCDDAFAASTPLGKRLIHGTFGITLALGSLEAQVLKVADKLVAALGLKEWNYKAPIFLGDSLHIELKISDKRVTSRGDRYILQRHIKLINQDDVVVQEGKVESMFALPGA